VVTGGTIGKEFVNRYFAAQLRDSRPDGYSRGPWTLAAGARADARWADAPGALRQRQGAAGAAATAVKGHSLPGGAEGIYVSAAGGVAVARIRFCEASGRRAGGAAGFRAEAPRACARAARAAGACSCGTIFLLAEDFGRPGAPRDPAWEWVLRAAAAPPPATPPPPPPPPSAGAAGGGAAAGSGAGGSALPNHLAAAQTAAVEALQSEACPRAPPRARVRSESQAGPVARRLRRLAFEPFCGHGRSRRRSRRCAACSLCRARRPRRAHAEAAAATTMRMAPRMRSCWGRSSG